MGRINILFIVIFVQMSCGKNPTNHIDDGPEHLNVMNIEINDPYIQGLPAPNLSTLPIGTPPDSELVCMEYKQNLVGCKLKEQNLAEEQESEATFTVEYTFDCNSFPGSFNMTADGENFLPIFPLYEKQQAMLSGKGPLKAEDWNRHRTFDLLLNEGCHLTIHSINKI